MIPSVELASVRRESGGPLEDDCSLTEGSWYRESDALGFSLVRARLQDSNTELTFFSVLHMCILAKIRHYRIYPNFK